VVNIDPFRNQPRKSDKDAHLKKILQMSANDLVEAYSGKLMSSTFNILCLIINQLITDDRRSCFFGQFAPKITQSLSDNYFQSDTKSIQRLLLHLPAAEREVRI